MPSLPPFPSGISLRPLSSCAVPRARPEMKPPETYAEWSAALGALAVDDFRDDEILSALESGRIAWVDGVAGRFTQALADVFSQRLKRIQTALQRDLDLARGAEAGVANAMVGARRRLQPLVRLAALPALLENVRVHFCGELGSFVRRAQSSLEDSALAADRTGRLRAVFRHSPLDPFPPPPVLGALASSAPESPRPPAFTGGRRIILK